MLTLVNDNYQPPTGYAILQDNGFPLGPSSAARLYNTIEALKGSGWIRNLGQYGITRLEWRGMLDDLTSDLSPDTIHLILPRGPGNVPGFETQWQAYHNVIGPFVFAWLPASLVAYGPAVLTFDQWMVGATHELMEALTDAEPGQGWVNEQANDEGADDCESPALPFAGTLVSSYWLNDQNRCLQAGDL